MYTSFQDSGKLHKQRHLDSKHFRQRGILRWFWDSPVSTPPFQNLLDPPLRLSFSHVAAACFGVSCSSPRTSHLVHRFRMYVKPLRSFASAVSRFHIRRTWCYLAGASNCSPHSDNRQQFSFSINTMDIRCSQGPRAAITRNLYTSENFR